MTIRDEDMAALLEDTSREEVRALLEEQARRRDARVYGSTRKLSPNANRNGVAGEYAFARDMGLALDLSDKPAGDRGIDFWLPLVYSVDVKAPEHHDWLCVEAGKVRADIYVMARPDAGDILAAELLGWVWRAEVLAAEPRDVFGSGIVSHAVHRDDLRSMSELRRRVVGLRAPMMGVV